MQPLSHLLLSKPFHPQMKDEKSIQKILAFSGIDVSILQIRKMRSNHLTIAATSDMIESRVDPPLS